MAEINWTAEAEFWLKDIYDYIALDNKPKAAARVVSGIYKKAQILKDFPEIGYKTSDGGIAMQLNIRIKYEQLYPKPQKPTD